MSEHDRPLAARVSRTASPRRALIIVAVASALAGCREEPSRWDQVQQETRRNAPAVSREAVAGGEFNKMFPKSDGESDIIYTQEKRGFAQAVLKKQGNEVATLSIFDTVSNPEAAEKYRSATAQLKGYPMADVGENGTAVLVGDRFQVEVRSKDANFGKADREEWLGKFDLANLERLVKMQ